MAKLKSYKKSLSPYISEAITTDFTFLGGSTSNEHWGTNGRKGIWREDYQWVTS